MFKGTFISFLTALYTVSVKKCNGLTMILNLPHCSYLSNIWSGPRSYNLNQTPTILQETPFNTIQFSWSKTKIKG